MAQLQCLLAFLCIAALLCVGNSEAQPTNQSKLALTETDLGNLTSTEEMEKLIHNDEIAVDSSWANAPKDFTEFGSKIEHGANATVQQVSLHDPTLQALMRSERSDSPPVPPSNPKPDNLMRREQKRPALVEITDTGDAYELVEVPEGKEEEIAEEYADPSIQWGAAALTPEQEEEEERRERLLPGSVVEYPPNPALKSVPPPLHGDLARQFGVPSVHHWDMYHKAGVTDAKPTSAMQSLRR
eukprot:gnl/MRDRNA2_/MRDRNA2_89273_c0_seq1.p1 gnl/MRDRNA2_/MRDRNA2_89273_c0~~gnl/MRDRNA2_/MRDRNA2_89273_c0_seq1.p1  ORF type:complete len:266 (+),score=78.04 gnl/MRDRNA2_/MRDRNA2_89273_c0_seq1:75-800(+)